MQEQHPPVAHGMLRDVEEGGGDGDDPDAGMAENPFLQLPGGLFLLDRFPGKLFDGGKAFAFGGVGNKDEGHNQADGSRRGRRQESPLPARRRDDEAGHDHGDGLAQLGRGREDAVHGATAFEREPSAQGNGAGRRAHGLHPAVDAPEEREGGQKKARRPVPKAQKAQDEVHEGRYANPDGHETADVAVVGDEAVEELPYRVHKVEGRADDTELPCRENAAVDEGLLHHAKGHAAYVVEGVGYRHAPEGTGAEASVRPVHLGRRNFLCARFADTEPGVQGHGANSRPEGWKDGCRACRGVPGGRLRGRP